MQGAVVYAIGLPPGPIRSPPLLQGRRPIPAKSEGWALAGLRA
eukprot:CAMPEP_0197893422 /NCGR_PEP_ID=MMETSP1439-20131203/32750_1 /TAXON_ID=66791 /ORGANISM="Gonyaulax spinifera, Strain CCMP409" /LENGTH=42 /DNA_ID= /DNA_START= /DNA_END= /DNA_ORIENTATION=